MPGANESALPWQSGLVFYQTFVIDAMQNGYTKWAGAKCCTACGECSLRRFPALTRLGWFALGCRRNGSMGRDAIGCGMQRRAEDIVCSSKQGAFGVKTCNINLIAHGSGEGVGHTADHVHVCAVQRHDLIMAMQVLSVIPVSYTHLTGTAYEAEAFGVCCATEDQKGAMKAFTEKTLDSYTYLNK